MIIRPRRNRKSSSIRALVQENWLYPTDLMYPLFIKESGDKETIDSMPGIYRHNPDSILREIENCIKLGICAFDIFPVVNEKYKDKYATNSHNPSFFYLKSLEKIKQSFPEATIMTDVAMDPYSSDGHDGLVENGEILNDETLKILGQMALAQAAMGIDIIGPSDMMDGRVGYIRRILDSNGYQHVSIMSYTAKYASAFYGPFRDALHSAPKSGDKKTYQMNPANSKEALRESVLDQQEGADILMVKPAMAYLDIIHQLKESSNLPISAYQVSGEYAMLHAAAQKGWLDLTPIMMESVLSIKRAGADIILTYFAPEIIKNVSYYG